jgi:hypothetical protein
MESTCSALLILEYVLGSLKGGYSVQLYIVLRIIVLNMPCLAALADPTPINLLLNHLLSHDPLDFIFNFWMSFGPRLLDRLGARFVHFNESD